MEEIVEGMIKSVVFHNDANGYTVLHVEVPGEFERTRKRCMRQRPHRKAPLGGMKNNAEFQLV